jgi:AhpD family alkylhydroperoxidase
MRLLRKMRGYLRVLRRARRNRTDLPRELARRPQLAAATTAYETALVFSNCVDSKLKVLAELKAAALTNCEFCLDIGSALARDEGLTERQLLELHVYQSSGAFTELEKLVIAFAEAMTRTPAAIPDALRKQMLHLFTRTQLVELAASVAWENQRGRLYQALGIRPAGFSDGAVCALPDTIQTAV